MAFVRDISCKIAAILLVGLGAGCQSGNSNDKPADNAEIPKASSNIPSVPSPSPSLPVLVPKEDEAKGVVRDWIIAIASNDPTKAAAQCSVPFRLADQTAKTSAIATVTESAQLLSSLTAIASGSNVQACLGDTQPKLEAWGNIPPRPMSFDSPEWGKIIPPAATQGHVFLTYTSKNPKKPTQILYGLFTVMLSDGTPKIDAALLKIVNEGK